MHLRNSESRRLGRGFTLIELVGTLAILALLAWIAADGVFNRLKEAQRQDEAGRLAEIAAALVRGVIHRHIIPAETNWAPAAAQELAEPLARVARNGAGWDRRLIFDPAFRLGSPLAPPPFSQSAPGSLPPTSARAVLLSTVAADFPSLTSVRFDDLWECPPGRLPAHWSSRWDGKPGDLMIERINFAPLFHRVCLNNLNLDALAGYAVDSPGPITAIPAGGRVDTAFLTDTRLFLLGTDGAVQLCERLTEDVSFDFEAGRWGRLLSSGAASSRGPLAAVFDQFVRAPASGFGTAPADVAQAMHALVGGYVSWASAGFPRTTTVTGQPAPALRLVTEARLRLTDFAGLLLGSSPDSTPP